MGHSTSLLVIKDHKVGPCLDCKSNSFSFACSQVCRKTFQSSLCRSSETEPVALDESSNLFRFFPRFCRNLVQNSSWDDDVVVKLREKIELADFGKQY